MDRVCLHDSIPLMLSVLISLYLCAADATYWRQQAPWPTFSSPGELKSENSAEKNVVNSAYLCGQHPEDCYIILTSTPPTQDTEAEHLKENVQEVEFSAEKFQLHNGSTVDRKVMRHESFTFAGSSPSTPTTGISQFTKKILATEVAESKEQEEEDNLKNQSRVIAFSITPNPPTNTTSSSLLTTYPTITLAQLARQLIFPDWLWTRFAATRKTGVATTGVTTATVKPHGPSITFDSNFSRFLKLFTLVRFQNTPCISPSGLNGTCYSSRDCSVLGGTATSQCANGFGVCCVFQVGCGGQTSRNGTYFISTGVTFSANQVQTCNVQILKTTTAVAQIRLDFQIFSLRQPEAGSCEMDRFVVSGQNTNNVIPILCGQNSGSHVYVETSQSSGGIQLSIMTTGEGARSWSIRVTQYEANSPLRAPYNCLQYYTNVMGSFRSFNYISDTAPQYLNNLNYAICIRREAGFCSVTYSNAGPDGTYQPFQIVNANAEGELIVAAGQAGVGIRDCPYDYIVINGLRLCGERLNDATTAVMYSQDAPVTDSSNGPFIVAVRTNEIDVGGGFNLYYRQNPCMSNSG